MFKRGLVGILSLFFCLPLLGANKFYQPIWFVDPTSGVNNFHVGFHPPTLVENSDYTLPEYYPVSSGLVLSSTDLGVLSWVTSAGVGLTQYGVLTGGGTGMGPVAIAPNASTAYTLVSGGVSANPSWGVLPVGGGGTGQSTFAAGALSSDGTNINSGVLPVADGGTGAATLTSGNVLVGSGTSAVDSATGINVPNPGQIHLRAAGSYVEIDNTTTATGLQSFSNNTLNVQNTSNGDTFPAVVSPNPSTNGLMIVRGGGNTGGSSVTTGEGYSYDSGGSGAGATGEQPIAFTTNFQDVPVCTCTIRLAAGTCAWALNPAASGFTVATYLVSAGVTTATNLNYSFICVGQRNSSN